MNKTLLPTWQRALLLAACLMLVTFAVAWAQSGGEFNLSRYTVAGGGSTSSGGSYTLGGTAGQPAASTSTGGEYSLVGGFSGDAGAPAEFGLYLPIVTDER